MEKASKSQRKIDFLRKTAYSMTIRRKGRVSLSLLQTEQARAFLKATAERREK